MNYFCSVASNPPHHTTRLFTAPEYTYYTRGRPTQPQHLGSAHSTRTRPDTPRRTAPKTQPKTPEDAPDKTAQPTSRVHQQNTPKAKKKALADGN
ncbi:hypothetical protein BT67DRAFT_441271 [Trichocladium antarcticum]|uniref:Uncharacterized protein n=1 Tax=Trichocladium antarcticum TaxID=1450529 RepID=A0AAN6UKR5_9PEZI|nr:hypothetical protein BT67DRAFT_441271 [Trichocladium antarcticum]